ncbi:MAG TPA: FecR family protein [Bacteroidota bacterium]
MKRKSVFLILVVVSLFLLSPAWKAPQDKGDFPATVIKVVKSVDKKSPTTGWQKALLADQLHSGYELRTEQGSFAMIKFPDETKIIVRQNSIVQVKAQVQGRQVLDRSIYMTKGNVAFDVKKQATEQFRFSSPISVASIRGTQGGYSSGADSVDQLIINEGLATLTNLLSHLSQDVSSGQIGITYGNGQILVQNSNPDQKQQGDIGNTGLGGQGGNQGQGGQKSKHQLRIPGQDKDGHNKTIIFEWEE